MAINESNGNRLDLFYNRFTKIQEVAIETWKITSNPDELEFHDMGKGIRSPSTVSGYIVFVDHIERFLGYLVKFSRINSNGKWIFLFNFQTFKEVELVFEQAWIRHKMLNILGIVVIGTGALI